MATEVQSPVSATEHEPVIQGEAKIYVASQWRLMWRKFRKHKLAVWAGVVTIAIYLVALFAEFLAPFDPNRIPTRRRRGCTSSTRRMAGCAFDPM
jgi:peptide/nickel transport system permease protein